MPLYEFVSTSMAASATLDDALSAKRFRTSKHKRVLRSVAGAVRDNTPALADVRMEVYIGEVMVLEVQPGLDRTTGAPIQAEDYKPVNLPVSENEAITVKLVNLDAGGAHTVLVGLHIEGF